MIKDIYQIHFFQDTPNTTLALVQNGEWAFQRCELRHLKVRPGGSQDSEILSRQPVLVYDSQLLGLRTEFLEQRCHKPDGKCS
jgi:hypothetical protein